MSDDDWTTGYVRSLGVRLAGDLIGDLDERGEKIVGETLLILLNAHHDTVGFALPKAKEEHQWELVLATSDPGAPNLTLEQGSPYPVLGRSLSVFRIRVRDEMDVSLTAVQVDTLIKDKRPLPAHSDRPALATP